MQEIKQVAFFPTVNPGQQHRYSEGIAENQPIELAPREQLSDIPAGHAAALRGSCPSTHLSTRPQDNFFASPNALLTAAASQGGIWLLEKVLQTSSNVSEFPSLYLGSSALLFFNLIFNFFLTTGVMTWYCDCFSKALL